MGDFPDVGLMFFANLFSAIASCHLSLCHYMYFTAWAYIASGNAPAIPPDATDKGNEKMAVWYPASINTQWLIMTCEWFACFVCLLIWSHKWGDGLGKAGNWIKMLATVCFFVEDAFFYVGAVDANWFGQPGITDGCLFALCGITLFWIGGVVHTIGFVKLFGWKNLTTLGIFLLMLGAFILMIFFHLLAHFPSTAMWQDFPDTVRMFTCLGDGLLFTGSVVLLTPMIEILFNKPEDESEGAIRKSLTAGADDALLAGYGATSIDAKPLADHPLNSEHAALVIVDFQKDFMEGGALAVPGADHVQYKGAMENFIKFCRSEFKCQIVWSQDSHCPGHSSFITSYDEATIKEKGMAVFQPCKLTRKNEAGEDEEYEQTIWPEHCVADTPGWMCVMSPLTAEYIQRKGERKEFDSYSAFKDDGGKRTGLGDYLKNKDINTVVCVGLATDYCVKFTCLDSVGEGFKTFAIPSLCRGIAPNFDWANYTDGGVELTNDPSVTPQTA
ncbi:unnamed protein product [Amoebophrya sp. A25]|nr:unnamed protein product [Amoebophrya sp. A25]|eukprot:GSA25T00018133001.1